MMDRDRFKSWFRGMVDIAESIDMDIVDFLNKYCSIDPLIGKELLNKYVGMRSSNCM